MDNKADTTSTTQPAPETVSQQGTQPVPQPNLMVSPQTEQHPIPDNTEAKSSSKMVFFLIGGIVIAILAAGGIYLYLNNQKPVVKTESEQIAPVITPAPQAVTEEEVQSVNVSDIEAEFTDVNKDLQGL